MSCPGGDGYAYQLNRALPLHSVAVEDTAFATLTQRSLKRAADLLKSSDVVPRDASRCFTILSPQKSSVGAGTGRDVPNVKGSERGRCLTRFG